MNPGSLLGPYEILAPLGEGTESVYRARDTRVGRVVAIKFLPARLRAERPLAVQLERDARALASLNHRNIVAIHEFDVDADPPFVASELIEGAT
ncbi:MAG TPA: serine/threonine protein kinase, partial [Thermoanaerobaculia bacterium]|nr:serine/threonine protein kinase [Thermoanaerobaculia bacterium]